MQRGREKERKTQERHTWHAAYVYVCKIVVIIVAIIVVIIVVIVVATIVAIIVVICITTYIHKRNRPQHLASFHHDLPCDAVLRPYDSTSGL